MEVQEIPLGQLVPSPNNPRIIRDKDPDLVELAKSIESLGVMSPIVVREINVADAQFVFEIVAGERRFRASKIAGKETVPALVRALTDDEALELTVTENLQREDLLPLEEANGVASLVGTGHSHQEIADRLGKPVTWVARRARISSLTEKWRKAIADPKNAISTWSASMLEVVARIDKAAQDHALAELETSHRRCNDAGDVRRAVAGFTRELRLAPWKLADETLHPKAGACLVCMKRSSCNPGLFDDEIDERNRKVPATSDRCLDALCWEEKANRNLEAEAEALKAEHGTVVFSGHLYYGEKAPAFARQLVNEWEGAKAKKGEKGAVPVLRVTGEEKGKVEWRSFTKSSSSKAQKAAAGGKKVETPLADRRKALRLRREAHAVNAFKAALVEGKVKEPAAAVVWRLVAAFGTSHKHDLHSYAAASSPLVKLAGLKLAGYGSIDPWKLYDKLSGTDARVIEALWIGTREVLANRLQFFNNDQAAERFDEIERIAPLVSEDLGKYIRAAEAAIPEPKSWAKLAEAEAAKKRAAKKTPTKKTPAKAAKKGAAK